MSPRVNLADLKAVQAATVVRAAKRKKKIPAADAGQYELRRLRKGPRIEVESVRVEVETSPVVKGSISTGIPLTEVLGGSSVGTVQAGVGRSYLPEPTRDKIRSVLVLGDRHRFE